MGRVTPYRYGQEGLARVGEALVFRTARPRRWPAIAVFAVFVGIFCRADSLRGFATAAPNPAARSNEMNFRMAGAVSALMMAGSTYAQEAVQWRADDGGNDHWYLVVTVPQGITWTEAHASALNMNALLACLESSTERAFCVGQFGSDAVPSAWAPQYEGGAIVFGPWLGGYQVESGLEPAGGWFWLTGAAFDPSWQSNCCNNSCNGSADEDRLHLHYEPGQQTPRWNDLPDVVGCGNQPRGFIVEFSADCNSDGIVDYGQIRAGDLADTNANNIPDCCETGTVCGCPADVILDGVVNGIDLAVIINAWSTDGGKFPRADIDGNGLVDGADLAIVLGSWGLCS